MGDRRRCITDLGFSYSYDTTKKQLQADVYQKRPNSTDYYNITEYFWPTGGVAQLSGLLGMPTLSYGADGEGRPATVSASIGQNPVTGVVYNLFGQPTQVTLGSADVDTFEYDATGRMTQYQFRVAPPIPNTVTVRFTNDSCSGCSGPPNNDGDRNLFISSLTVGSTVISPGDPSVSYDPTLNRYDGRYGVLGYSGDLISTNPSSTRTGSITVNAFGQRDYGIYPHMQLLVNGGLAGEWDVTDTAQDYTVDLTAHVTGALTWNPNGTLQQLKITDPVNSANQQTCDYAHDQLGRISSVDCGAGNWKQLFSYDAFGNVSKDVPVDNQGQKSQPTYVTATNQVAEGTWDKNGNLTTGNSYTWDAENHLLTVDTNSATYDALGRTVEIQTGGQIVDVVYAPDGQKLALMSGQTLKNAFVPLPGGGTAVYDSNGLAYYRHPDWLGSSRLASKPDRGLYSSTAYAPFGEPYAQSGTTDLSFTGQTQDTNAGLYDFLYRRYSPVQGRWLSPDPAGLAAVNPTNPQSWNRYAYVGNRPVHYVDPLGLVIYTGACVELIPGPDGHSFPGPCGQNSPGQKGVLQGGVGVLPRSMLLPGPDEGGDENPACAIPSHPDNADVNQNIAAAKTTGEGGALWFYNQVRNKGAWDYKQADRNYEDFGNFNYGATGAAAGFANQVLLRMAGWASWRAGTRNPNDGWFFWKAPYGDNPKDQAWIQKGIDYYNAGCWK